MEYKKVTTLELTDEEITKDAEAVRAVCTENQKYSMDETVAALLLDTINANIERKGHIAEAVKYWLRVYRRIMMDALLQRLPTGVLSVDNAGVPSCCNMPMKEMECGGFECAVCGRCGKVVRANAAADKHVKESVDERKTD